jgi:hypothetical protein
MLCSKYASVKLVGLRRSFAGQLPMLMICAKKDVYRSAADTQMPLLRHVVGALREVEAQLRQEPAPALPVEPFASSQLKLDTLRQLGHQMETAMHRATARGLGVPNRAPMAAYRYLEFVRGLVATDASGNSTACAPMRSKPGR